ncbi:hypothetical protein Bind_3349 [Beijerinckia indica subsp. indica ATCC 9039]|uniref:Uncharacterized protein n=1 Tax=Beijerinckia indica subsp. indica (strain ATCC 9039 / DSM 1715 / NCIMB 8712) TaxID=395963 RepID=B2IDX4_BEII9|nr:hypothetical protein Bind_3349 [Beijerinckia indica subsp. indica ATCC 9039]
MHPRMYRIQPMRHSLRVSSSKQGTRVKVGNVASNPEDFRMFLRLGAILALVYAAAAYVTWLTN